MLLADRPDYVLPIREIRAAVHPQTGGAGVQLVDCTNSSVFLPLSNETLQRLTCDIQELLASLQARQAETATGR